MTRLAPRPVPVRPCPVPVRWMVAAVGAGRQRLRGLPLSWRVAVAFALASLLVTGLLALVTWSLASSYMLDQREQSAAGQFAANSRLVTGYLRRHDSADLRGALLELEYDQDDVIGLGAGAQWVTDGPVGRPVELAEVAHDLLAEQPVSTTPTLVTYDKRRVLATAISIPDRRAQYVELSSLTDLGQTLQFVKTVLLVGVAGSVVLGLGLGRWAGRQALRPLTELTSTAQRVAGGDLGARLPEQGDADLAALATTFNRTTAALEQRVARDARFAGDVSHELRSPLTTMINATAVLNRRRDELSPVARHALALLTTDIERFQQMVVDLLEISRGLGTDERELEPCDLAELVRHTMMARHEPARLRTEPPHPLVLGDRRRLDRVVANLLDNAARHAGGAVAVTVGVRQGRARLEIDDDGPGIPADLHQRVFERFTRGPRAGERGHDTGTGLGLALVAQHVRRHDGAVWVEDRPSGGARFVVELPLH